MTEHQQAEAVEQALSGTTLQCDMSDHCKGNVTHMDIKGFAYCTPHGLSRRSIMPCRKLRPWELRKLRRGEQLAHY